MYSEAEVPNARYSAFGVKNVTSCFFNLQEIATPALAKTYLRVEFLFTLHPAQSYSLKTTRHISCAELLKTTQIYLVPATERKICFGKVQSDFIGFSMPCDIRPFAMHINLVLYIPLSTYGLLVLSCIEIHALWSHVGHRSLSGFALRYGPLCIRPSKSILEHFLRNLERANAQT